LVVESLLEWWGMAERCLIEVRVSGSPLRARASEWKVRGNRSAYSPSYTEDKVFETPSFVGSRFKVAEGGEEL
jgi:hypothetical protein